LAQTSPVTRRALINQNRLVSNHDDSPGARTCLTEAAVVFGRMKYSRPGFGNDPLPATAEFAWLLQMAQEQADTKYAGDIFTNAYFPIHDTFDRNSTSTVVGLLDVVIYWARFFTDLLPDHVQGLIVVLDNGCDEPYTYEINGGRVDPLGHGDLHDATLDQSLRSTSWANITTIPDGTPDGLRLHHADGCRYALRVYQSPKFRHGYVSNKPVIITVAVSMAFIVFFAIFVVYDRLVERRQRQVERQAKKTDKIVASLFVSDFLVAWIFFSIWQNVRRQESTFLTHTHTILLLLPSFLSSPAPCETGCCSAIHSHPAILWPPRPSTPAASTVSTGPVGYRRLRLKSRRPRWT
jgi:hypothetical protein